MRVTAASLFFLFTLACASGSGDRPADVAKPGIVVRQAGSIFFGSSTTAPVSFDITITNNATVPLIVKEVELTSPGMMQYTIARESKLFREVIEPGQSRTLGMTATAYTRDTRNRSDEPLSVQTFVRFEVNGKPFREVVLQQFAGSGQ